MFGDVRIKWQRFWKRMFCHHEYKYHRPPISIAAFTGWYECSKCGRIRSSKL